ncbi:MAG: hypothetical protein IKB15_06190 [Alistipes sp.]|nr:hypothetical protein [Alistipes sp.]
MKKLFLSLAIISVMLTSCTSDNVGVNIWGKRVTFTISVDVPELATRSGETGMDSGLGAIDNFSAADEWDNFDLRYIVEVYEVVNGEVNQGSPIISRITKTFDEYSDTSFDVRLAPNRDYRVVVWADFVEQGKSEDLHYDTADLRAIKRKTPNTAMDECQDAYFIKQDIHVGSSKLSKDLVLKRPFGKIRVVTTDYDQANNNAKPKTIKVTFYNHTLYTTLDAVTGVASGETHNEYTYTVAKDAPYTKGYDENEKNMTLFADYILAGENAQEVNFTLNAWDDSGKLIKSLDFNTQIPLGRNKLTTIMGDMLTRQSQVDVSVDDNMDGETIIDIKD